MALMITGNPQEHEIYLQDFNGIVMPMSLCVSVCAGMHTQVHTHVQKCSIGGLGRESRKSKIKHTVLPNVFKATENLRD